MASPYKVKFEDCEAMGGHCFRRMGITLTSNPPQYPEYCKHCGATRTGVEQSRYAYDEPEPYRD